MKLKELFKCVEYQNKMKEFTNNYKHGYKETTLIKIDEYALRYENIKSVKKFIEIVNEEFYANINENIIVENNNGNFEITFEQSIPNYNNGKFEYKKEKYTLNIYLDTIQEWI